VKPLFYGPSTSCAYALGAVYGQLEFPPWPIRFLMFLMKRRYTDYMQQNKLAFVQARKRACVFLCYVLHNNNTAKKHDDFNDWYGLSKRWGGEKDISTLTCVSIMVPGNWTAKFL
jgi:hypothetical protein